MALSNVWPENLSSLDELFELGPPDELAELDVNDIEGLFDVGVAANAILWHRNNVQNVTLVFQNNFSPNEVMQKYVFFT